MQYSASQNQFFFLIVDLEFFYSCGCITFAQSATAYSTKFLTLLPSCSTLSALSLYLSSVLPNNFLSSVRFCSCRAVSIECTLSVLILIVHHSRIVYLLCTTPPHKSHQSAAGNDMTCNANGFPPTTRLFPLSLVLLFSRIIRTFYANRTRALSVTRVFPMRALSFPDKRLTLSVCICICIYRSVDVYMLQQQHCSVVA